MFCIGARTQQVRRSSSDLQGAIPLPPALTGQPPGIHSFPVFSTASLPSQLVRYNPSKTWEAQALAPPMLYEAGVG